MSHLWDYRCDRVTNRDEGRVVPEFFGEYIGNVVEASNMLDANRLVRY